MCGCSNGGLIQPTVKATDSREALRSRAAMCGLCIGGTRGPCPETGRDAAEMVRDGGCPLGRHPDGRGIVRWQGTEWLGVPAVIRWAWPVLRRLHGLPALTGPLPGCGCHAASKAAWLAFQRERPATARLLRKAKAALVLAFHLVKGRLDRQQRRHPVDSEPPPVRPHGAFVPPGRGGIVLGAPPVLDLERPVLRGGVETQHEGVQRVHAMSLPRMR
jgi:hypothetical protein